jgi:hypothetical protein
VTEFKFTIDVLVAEQKHDVLLYHYAMVSTSSHTAQSAGAWSLNPKIDGSNPSMNDFVLFHLNLFICFISSFYELIN